MTLKQLVEAIDAQILKGDIIGAFETFAADNCVTLSTPDDITTSKAQKMEALKWFFSNVANVNRIERLGYTVGKDSTDSRFVFDFTNRQGNRLVYDEVIRRAWKNGKLVEEQYLLGQTLVENEPAAAAEPKATKASTAKKTAAPKADAKPAAKTAEPKADAKPTVKTAKTQTATKADDLTLVEGIGPKIAELLTQAGITTFAQLANTKPTAIKSILETAGKRYQMHDPATWPKQAALARDGKTAELAKWQGELKAGK